MNFSKTIQDLPADVRDRRRKLHKNYTEQRSIALFIGMGKSRKLIKLQGALSEIKQ